MSTSGLYGFRMEETEKIAFCHSRADLANLGTSVLRFVKTTSTEDMKSFFNNIVLVNDNQGPSREEIDNLIRLGVVHDITRPMRWCDILRPVEGKFDIIATSVKYGIPYYMINNAGLMNNSYLCNYGYVIDIDNEYVGFYKGSSLSSPDEKNKTMLNQNDIKTYALPKDPNPCTLVIPITFTEIRTTLYPKMLGEKIKAAYGFE